MLTVCLFDRTANTKYRLSIEKFVLEVRQKREKITTK
jgi:hypothetical protein